MATSSNSSASRNKNKKRKIDQNQKTLGMTWGANSRSSSRSTFNNSPFSDVGSYMVMKNQKLLQQFDAEASSSSLSRSSSAKPIFEGVSIFVDGYTVPSSQELRGYMLKYGGRFQNYFSRRQVTHIICSNLPDSKIQNLRSFSGGLPVVKPEWVLDSVVADKLLSWVAYQLYPLGSETGNQPKLSNFFSLKNSEVSKNSKECTEAMSKSSNSSSVGDPNHAGKYDAKEYEETGDLISDENMQVHSAAGSYEQATNGLESEDQRDGNNDADINKTSHEFLQQSSAVQESKSTSDGFLDNHLTEFSSNSTRPASTGHSSLTDVNFVENFFKYSRLHFIGTWRNRYRKRYPTLSSGIYPSSHDNSASVYQEKVVIHIDMDCFFVSVITRNHPDLENKPVAVCHSDNPRGTSEISSANYPARDYGIKAGMFVRDAKILCPHLVVVPYDFKAYEEVADQFYDILHKHCSRVQAISCDEAFMDVTDSRVEDPQLLALNIRKEILGMTRCSASAGIASNMLLARVATRIAKPNGQFYIPPEKVDDYLHDLPVKSLPGVGRALHEKLKSRQIETCAQMRLVSKESLQKDFGKKTGDMLWSSCRGIDCRLVNTIQQESKSIGADVNWGVRFKDMHDTKRFLSTLSKEVSLRLQGCGVMGRTFTLKIKKRKAGAGEPVKYMGHGDCENLSRSITLPLATDDGDVVERISAQLLDHFHIDPKDIRGMGLQASKLESTDTNKQGHEKKSIRNWLVSSSARTGCRDNDNSKQNIGAGRLMDPCCNVESLVQKDGEISTGEASMIQNASLPSLDELDIGVIESLPPDVLKEIDELYSGKLKNMISKKGKKPCSSIQLMACKSIDGMTFKSIDDTTNEKAFCSEPMAPSNKISGMRTSELVNASEAQDPIDLMPLSLSQLDPKVLQDLPDNVKADLLKSLPAHRIQDIVYNDISRNCGVNKIDLGEPSSSKHLWSGDPPIWVNNFSLSSCHLLNILAISFREYGSGCVLSTIFQHIMPKTCFLDMGSDGHDDSVGCLSELIKQYVDIKVGSDIEEIYACSNILRRLSSRSKIFIEVYENILPHLQVAVGEHYGGTLNVPFTA